MKKKHRSRAVRLAAVAAILIAIVGGVFALRDMVTVRQHEAEAPPSREIREQEVVTSDLQLEAFLLQIKSFVEAHDWPSYLALCAEDHYRSRKKYVGMSTPHYLAESMSLYTLASISGEEQYTYEDLDTIEKLRFTSLEEIANVYEGRTYRKVLVKGVITLVGGELLEMEITISRNKIRGLEIRGSVG